MSHDVKALHSFYCQVAKPLLDRVIGILLMLALSPILIVIALVIRLTSPGPVLFTQVRAGYKAQPFKIYKFRSMTVQADDPSKQAFLDDPRITPVGRIIRRYKIDELPQLLNVVLGDMSLVGPRPTLIEQMKDYTPEQMIRYEVRPGLTGWAQVNGNILLSVYERRQHDVYYVNHLSFGLDLKILCMTVAVVLWGEKVKESSQT
jgi:lipopolysaccharide/colanic/teichoic acid biosynthesis glycosyltransferase